MKYMDNLFKPQNLAIIGVSERKTNLTLNILTNLEHFKFQGKVFPVGPKGGEVFGKKIYKSVLDIPENIDSALILTPADTVPDIVEQCGKKGIKSLVIQSAGFREFGEKGKEREKRLVEIADKYGIRFIGPNCIGLINFHNGMVLPFLILKDIYTKGNISIVTQSGGVGITFLNIFSGEHMGIAKFASIGNKLNLDENDLIEYYLQDKDTDIILAYLEGISDGRRLMKLAETSSKPILLYKANTGTLGQSIAASHTAAISSDDAVVDTALKQCGIARFKDRQTLINYLKVLPMPKIKGNNLAILSRSGGHAILAADAAEKNNFSLAPFKKELMDEISKHFRASVINLTNPLDLGDVFDYDLYLKIIEATAKEDNVHAVVFIHVCFSSAEIPQSKALIEKTYELSQKYNKPILVCMEMDTQDLRQLRHQLKFPVLNSPLETIKSLALLRDFQYEKKREVKLPELKIDYKSSKKIIDQCLKEKRSPNLDEGLKIFEYYDIPIVKSEFAKTKEELVNKSKALGYPVAFKVVSNDISHKTDVGGVQLNLKNESELINAYDKMAKKIKDKMPAAKIDGVTLQPMLENGFELIIGAKNDPNFGPLVLAGLGGIFVEVFKDSAMRIAPFTEDEALSMLKELKGYKILKGTRGKKGYDLKPIIKTIIHLSKLISDFPEIKEIDINPFYTMEKSGYAIDARIIV